MKPHSRWVMLAIAFFTVFSFSFAMQSLPPLLPSLMSEFRISYATAGSLMTFVALPGLFLSILGGTLVFRYGLRVIGAAGLLLISLGALLCSLSSSLTTLQLARLTVGIGGPLVAVSALSLITQWFSSKERGLAMGIYAMHMPVAVASAFNVLGRVDASYGWRACFGISFALSTAILVSFLLFARERQAGDATALSFRPLRNSRIWIVGLIWVLFNMVGVSFATWAKTLFIEFKGFDPVYADFIASVPMIMGFATPLVGLLGDKLQRRRLLLIIAAIYMIIAYPLLPHFNGVTLGLFLAALGLSRMFFPPTVFALVPEIIGPRNAPLGFGVLGMCRDAGAMSGPFLIGLVMDAVHNFTSPMLAMSFLSFIALLLVISLKAR
ncbi:nitrate/nitrite transporter [Chloroflexota bacterium]